MTIILLFIGLTAFVWLSVRFYMTASAGRFETKIETDTPDQNDLAREQWWAKNRTKYNIGLVIAGFTAFISYAMLGSKLIGNNFEVTLFTTFFQGVGYLVMMFVANICYNLGESIDKYYNTENSEIFRQRLFNFGFWFSMGLPFLIPALIVFQYLF